MKGLTLLSVALRGRRRGKICTVFMCVRGCLKSTSGVLCHDSCLLTTRLAPASLKDPLILSPEPQELQTFYISAGVWIQVLMFAQQVTYTQGCLPSPCSSWVSAKITLGVIDNNETIWYDMICLCNLSCSFFRYEAKKDSVFTSPLVHWFLGTGVMGSNSNIQKRRQDIF